MPFSLSASVQFTETDLTTTIPAVATSIGATVGGFAWGPVDERTLVDDEDKLVSTFGTPNDTIAKDWFVAANFLSYSNNLQVVRVVGVGALNAGDSAGTLIKNSDHYTANIATIEASTNSFVSKYPGAYGNDVAVHIADSGTFVGWAYEDDFDYAPTGTELWVVVLYKGNIVEKFYTDLTDGTKDSDNQSMFTDDVVNRQSVYAWSVSANINVTLNGQVYVMASGVDGATVVDAERQLGWDLFGNSDEVDINLLMAGGASNVTAKYMIDNISAVRRDCIGFVSPQQTDVVNAATPEVSIVASRNSFSASSYAVMDGNYKYQYDKYNDKYRWIPLNGDIAGLCALTDYTNDAWWSPGGHNRGHIKNVTKLAFNPSKAQRDALYKNAVNPIINVKGEGPLLYGDKTMLIKPSAFGYINVRRLFIVLEKAIATAARYSLFEFNDTFTQNQFRNMVEPFLRDVQSRRGIYNFLVVADARTNTPEVVDRGEFKADIYISPSRSIQNIYLNFIATKSGVVFEELVAA